MSKHTVRKMSANETESAKGQSYTEYSLVLSIVIVAVIVGVAALGITLRVNLLEPANEQIAQSIAPCNVAMAC